jgi:hypothetical protein
MRDFTINVLAGVFLMFVAWRLNKFGALIHIEAFYLSWERRMLAVLLWLAPVAIPALMFVVWGFIGFAYLRTPNNTSSALFVGSTAFLWFVGPLFERDRPLSRLLSRWYRHVVLPGTERGSN